LSYTYFLTLPVSQLIILSFCQCVSPKLNNFRLEILGGGEPQPQKAIPDPADVPKYTQYQGYRHLCFRTPDVDATLAELNKKGVPTFAPAYDYAPIQRRLAFVLDNMDDSPQ
jgi:hypothetical protein